MTELKNLDLGDNPITNVAGYRDGVFEIFPNLLVLDNFTKEGEEYQSEDEEEDEDDDDYGGEEDGEAPEGAEDELDEEAEYDDEEGEDGYGDEEYGEEDQDDSADAELGKRKK